MGGAPGFPHRDPRAPTTPVSAPPTAPIPPPLGPSPLQRLIRTGIHALVLTIATVILAPALNATPLGRQLLAIIAPFSYVPWSVGASAGLNADRLAATILALILIIAGWPNDLLAPGTAAITGLITGLSARHLLVGGLHGQ